MLKHMYFWLGVFVAAFLTVPIAMGLAGMSVEEAKKTAVTVLIVMATLTVFLVLVLLNRDRILRFFTGKTEASLEEISNQALQAVGSAIDGNTDQTKKHVAELVAVGVNWYAWLGFYRWVAGTLVALLVVFTGLAGTVLLFVQNEKIEDQTTQLKNQNVALDLQNALDAQKVVSELRDRLAAHNVQSISTSFPSPQARKSAYVPVGGGCAISPRRTNVNPQSNPSEISSIKHLATTKGIKEITINALRFLLDDDNDTVALAALRILDGVKALPEGRNSFHFEGVEARSLDIRSAIEISFSSSTIDRFSCDNCSVVLYNSIVSNGFHSKEIKHDGTIVLGAYFGDDQYNPNFLNADGALLLGSFEFSKLEDNVVSLPTLVDFTDFELGEVHHSKFSALSKLKPEDLSETEAQFCVDLEFWTETHPFVQYSLIKDLLPKAGQ